MTSAPRVERVDDLVVDSQGLDPPTEKWLQAAREAADTDGIRENAYAERLQMCISCCTLMCMFPMVPNMYRVSHSRYVSERVSPSYSTTGIGPFYKNMESLPVEALPRHSRAAAEQLPSSCRSSLSTFQPCQPRVLERTGTPCMLQIPRQIRRGASLYIGSTTVGMHIYALADPW